MQTLLEHFDIMTPTERSYKLHLLNLLENKYKCSTMAEFLKRFNILLMDAEDGVAYVSTSTSTIAICSQIDQEQAVTLVKHELLHVYFEHIKKYIEKYPFLDTDSNLSYPFATGDENKDTTLRNMLWASGNIANDLHLSRHYDGRDKNNVLNTRIAQQSVDELKKIGKDLKYLTGKDVSDQIDFGTGLINELDNPNVTDGTVYYDYLKEYEKVIKKTHSNVKKIYGEK